MIPEIGHFALIVALMLALVQGILPDLFKEGKGVVAEGKLESDGLFHATQVLAKHDENYMPPEAKEALAEAKKAKAKEAAAKAALAGAK